MEYKDAIFAFLIFSTLSVCGCDAAANCSFDVSANDQFFCRYITEADFTEIRHFVETLLNTTTVYNVYFTDCDFTKFPAEDPGWFKGYDQITDFLCIDCHTVTFPMPFMYSMGNIMKTLKIEYSTLGQVVDGGDDPGLPFRNSLTELEFQYCNWTTGVSVANYAFSSYTVLTGLYFVYNWAAPVTEPFAFANSTVQDFGLESGYLGTKYDPTVSTLFDNLKYVTYMDITSNNFTTLAKDTFSLDPDKQPKLENCYLKENPWNCTCDLQWLKDFINENPQIDFDLPYCATPVNLPFNKVDFGC